MAQAPHALSEAHLDVRDLDRSAAYYRDVVGLELAYRLEERNVVLLWAGGRGPSMLGLWAGSSSPNAARLHLAFVLGLEAVLAAPATLRSAGVEPLDFDGQPTGEACVIEWMPVASVFFRDPDGHLLEFLSMLLDEPQPEVGVVSWSSAAAPPPGQEAWGA